MTGTIRCFVNEQGRSVPAGSTVREAVAALDAALADRVVNGEAYVTDARGIRVPSDHPLTGGAILRVVVSARTAVDDPDA